MIRKLLLAGASAALVATPVTAQAAVPARVPAKVAGKNEQIVGLIWQYLIFPVIIAAVLAAITGGDDNEAPHSP